MAHVAETDPYFGVRMKLDRAASHLDTLDKEVSAWLWRKPYTLYGEFEPWPAFGRGPDFGYYHLKFRDVALVPSHWPVVVGDFLHNARTALDHLVWQLVVANGQEPDRRNQFPICLAPEDFAKSLKASRLRGVHDDHVRIIAAAQPYEDKDYDGERPEQLKINQPLAILNNLSNTDKHQVLNPTIRMVRNVVWSPTPSTVRDLNLPDGTNSMPGFSDELTDGALLMSIVAERTGPDPHLDVDATVGAEINLGRDAPNGQMTATLRAILDEVRRIAVLFAR